MSSLWRQTGRKVPHAYRQNDAGIPFQAETGRSCPTAPSRGLQPSPCNGLGGSAKVLRRQETVGPFRVSFTSKSNLFISPCYFGNWLAVYVSHRHQPRHLSWKSVGCTGRIPPSPPAIYELLRVTEIGTQVRGVPAGHFDYSRARGIARDGILQLGNYPASCVSPAVRCRRWKRPATPCNASRAMDVPLHSAWP